ncbi:MAG: alpha/beta hydrolase [Methylocella sp.]
MVLNNRFEDAVFRFAQFVYDSKAEVVPVLFTWPSKGSLLAYGYDRESVEYSRDALEGGLRFLAKDPEVGEIFILAHSMGNWVTLEALRQMAIRAYKQIDQIKALGARRPKFILVTSEDDRALAFSRKFWGEPRLGSIDPDQEQTNLKREGIVAINAPPGQILTESRVSLGENILKTTAGAAASVGQAAGLLVTAPVAIVDQDTREHYGDQIDAVGQSLQDAATPQ